MKKVSKKLVSLSIATIMSCTALGINAGAESYSLHVSSTSAVTKQAVTAGYADQDDYVVVNYYVSTLTNGASVSYITLVGGSKVGTGKVSSTGSHYKTHNDSTYIDKGERILATMTLVPSSSTSNVAAGKVTGS